MSFSKSVERAHEAFTDAIEVLEAITPMVAQAEAAITENSTALKERQTALMARVKALHDSLEEKQEELSKKSEELQDEVDDFNEAFEKSESDLEKSFAALEKALEETEQDMTTDADELADKGFGELTKALDGHDSDVKAAVEKSLGELTTLRDEKFAHTRELLTSAQQNHADRMGTVIEALNVCADSSTAELQQLSTEMRTRISELTGAGDAAFAEFAEHLLIEIHAGLVSSVAEERIAADEAIEALEVAKDAALSNVHVALGVASGVTRNIRVPLELTEAAAKQIGVEAERIKDVFC